MNLNPLQLEAVDMPAVTALVRIHLALIIFYLGFRTGSWYSDTVASHAADQRHSSATDAPDNVQVNSVILYRGLRLSRFVSTFNMLNLLFEDFSDDINALRQQLQDTLGVVAYWLLNTGLGRYILLVLTSESSLMDVLTFAATSLFSSRLEYVAGAGGRL